MYYLTQSPLLCVCDEKTWDLLSRQTSSIQYSIINYTMMCIRSPEFFLSQILYPLIIAFPPFPYCPASGNHHFILYYYDLTFFFNIPHKSEIIQSSFFWVWFISLIMMSFSLICVVTAVNVNESTCAVMQGIQVKWQVKAEVHQGGGRG